MAQNDAEKTPINPIMNIPVPWVFVLVYFIGVGFQLVFPLALFPRDSFWTYLFRVAGITLAISRMFPGRLVPEDFSWRKDHNSSF